MNTRALPIFIALQCLDLLTTLIFLSKGVTEGNFLIAWIIPRLHAPWIGLAIAKLLAVSIGIYWYQRGRTNVMQLANAGYALVVLWNLAAIAAATIAESF